MLLRSIALLAVRAQLNCMQQAAKEVVISDDGGNSRHNRNLNGDEPE